MNTQKIEKWNVLSSEYLFREPWLTVRRDKVQLPNGNMVPSYYVMEYPAWVCILGITKEGKMLMVRQYRHGLQKVSYELCAGVVDPEDASYMEAAKRELLEETGYGKGNWEQFMVVSANPGTHNNLTYCFLAKELEQISSQHLEPTEDIAVELLEPDEVIDLLKRDEMPQAMHIAALWKYFYMKNRTEQEDR